MSSVEEAPKRGVDHARIELAHREYDQLWPDGFPSNLPESAEMRQVKYSGETETFRCTLPGSS